MTWQHIALLFALVASVPALSVALLCAWVCWKHPPMRRVEHPPPYVITHSEGHVTYEEISRRECATIRRTLTELKHERRH